MQSDMYFLVLSGTLIDGHERDRVEEALQRLLRVSPEQARSMLAGERSRIRKQLTLEKATRLRDKLATCGAGSFIEPVDRESTRWVPSASAAAEAEFDSDTAETAAALEVAGEEPLFDSESELRQQSTETGDRPEQVELPVEAEDLAADDIAVGAESDAAQASGSESESETQTGLEPEPEGSAESASDSTAEADAAAADDALVLEPMDEKEDEAATNEDTRPLQAVQDGEPGVDKDTEEIVLESELVSLESTGNAAAKPEQPAEDTAVSAPEPRPASKAKRPALGTKRLLLLAGVPVLLIVVAGGWYFFGAEKPSQPGPKQQARAQQVDSKRAVTEQRLESLGRSVRAWMKFYGSGDPAQVTLDRMQQDLDLPEAEMQDAWGTAIRYQPGSPNYTMVSAGPDRKFATADDLKRELKVE